MTNLPGSALRKFWNPTAFAFEFLTVLFLVFLRFPLSRENTQFSVGIFFL